MDGVLLTNKYMISTVSQGTLIWRVVMEVLVIHLGLLLFLGIATIFLGCNIICFIKAVSFAGNNNRRAEEFAYYALSAAVFGGICVLCMNVFGKELFVPLYMKIILVYACISLLAFVFSIMLAALTESANRLSYRIRCNTLI